MHLHCMTSGANFGAIMASDATALDMTALNVIDHALPRFGCVLTRVTLPHTVWPSWHQLLDSEVQVWEQLGLELFLLVKSRFVDHQSISCGTLFVTLWTRESRRADMFCLHMILNMRNLLWVVSTLGTLPRTTIILEHKDVHHDVQTLYCFSIGSYIKMVTFIWSILNMNISVNGLNWNYSCLWFIIACLVGQCLRQIRQENPEVETCLASTWFCTGEIFLELYWHSLHCQQPSSFLNMRFSTNMFRSSIVSAWGLSKRFIDQLCAYLTSCFLYWWDIRELRVGQNCWQIEHSKPEVCTCLASMCLVSVVLYFVR